MKAALLTAFGTPFEIVDDVEIDAPRRDEVLVRVTHCGVCHSDYTIYQGADPAYPLPVVLGHEAAGVIAGLGDGVTGLALDQPVILSMRGPCGQCFQCVRGAPVLCERQTRGQGAPRLRWRGNGVAQGFGIGAFADYVLVGQNAAVPIAHDTPGEVAAVIGCAVQTGVGAVANIARMSSAESALVIGTGTVGLCVIQGAVLAGATTIIAIDRSEPRRTQALQFGATHAFDPSEADLLDRIRGLTAGRGVDHAFDLVCAQGTPELAIAACRPGGTTVLIGVKTMGNTAALMTTAIVMQQKTVTGCLLGNCHPQRDFATFMDLWKAGRLAIDRLVTSVRPLRDIDQAMADLEATRGLRTVLAI